jgi:toxin ParE1/3/4
VTSISWSPLALRDVEAARQYIAQDSPHYAELVVARISAAVDRLEAFPESGRIVPEVGDPQLREIIMRPYRIVYRVRAGSVEIATVFHASRQFPDLG